MDDFYSHLQTRYDIGIHEGNPILYEKGTKNPALNGSLNVKIEELAKEFGKPRNWFVESMKERSAVEETNKIANGQGYVQPQQNPNLSIAEKLKAGTVLAAQQAGIVLPS